MPQHHLRSGTVDFGADGIALVTHFSGITLTEADADEFVDLLLRHAERPFRLLIDRRPHFDSDFGAIMAFRRQLPSITAGVAFYVDSLMGRSVALFYCDLYNRAGLPSEVFPDETAARAWLRSLGTPPARP